MLLKQIIMGIIAGLLIPSILIAAPKPASVAITFDDGPSPVYTPSILDILKKNHVNAVFFVLGKNAEKYPEIVKRAFDEGNAIGCHSYSHKNFTLISKTELEFEVSKCVDIVEKITGKKPVCFRPPYNHTTEAISSYINSKGMSVISVGIDSGDWEKPGIDKIVKCSVCLVKAGQTITLHDGTIDNEDRSQSVASVQGIIDGLHQRGFNIKTICRP